MATRCAWLYLLPGFAGLALIQVIPFLSSLQYVVLSDSIKRSYIGLQTLKEVFGSGLFVLALRNTAFLAFCGSFFTLSLGFIGACLLRGGGRASDNARIIAMLPYVVPVATMLFIWHLFFDDMGYAARLFSWALGIRVQFLKTNALIIPVLLLFIWRNVGVLLTIFLANMQSLDVAYYEYAELEGAHAISKHLHITLPMIAPAIAFAAMLSWISALKIFKEIYLLSGGYPSDRLYTIQHYMNNQLASLSYGKLVSASSATLLIVWVVFSLLLALARRTEDWGG